MTHVRRAPGQVRAITAELLATRLARGLSQRAVAEAIGLRQSDISALERGVHSPYLGTVCALADALDCDLVLVPRETDTTTTDPTA